MLEAVEAAQAVEVLAERHPMVVVLEEVPHAVLELQVPQILVEVGAVLVAGQMVLLHQVLVVLALLLLDTNFKE